MKRCFASWTVIVPDEKGLSELLLTRTDSPFISLLQDEDEKVHRRAGCGPETGGAVGEPFGLLVFKDFCIDFQQDEEDEGGADT